MKLSSLVDDRFRIKIKFKPVAGLVVSDIRCLIRTKVAQDDHRRISSHKENVLCTTGAETSVKTWMKLLRLKLVAKSRCKLTVAGERKLVEVIHILRRKT